MGTGSERSYDVFEKIHVPSKSVFVAGSGNLSLLDEFYKKAQGVTDKSTPEDVAEALRKASLGVQDAIMQTDAFDYFGVDREKYMRGEAVLSKELYGMLSERIDAIKRSVKGNTMFISGYGNGGFQIFYLKPCLAPGHFRKYVTIGSGSDLADAYMSKRLHDMEPKARSNISLSRGCKMLMEATRASWHNTGVGGRTQVVWTGKDTNVTQLDYEVSNTLQNILFLEERGLVDSDFTDGLFKDAVEGGAEYADLRKVLKRKVPKDALVDAFFVEGQIGRAHV